MECRTNVTNAAMKLIGGAGLGAVLMYLLDPQEGERRREAVGVVGRRGAEATGAALGSAWEAARETGQVVGEKAMKYGAAGATGAGALGSSLVERVAGLGSRLVEGTGEVASHVADTTYRAGRDVGRTSARYAKKPASWFREEEEHSYVPSGSTTTAAALALAAGVGLMYLMDPNEGRRRRAVLRDKSFKFLNETGDFFRRTGRHVANRSKGVYYESTRPIRRRMGNRTPQDQSLAQRLREKIGGIAGFGQSRQQPNVDVECDCGRVTLFGECAPEIVDTLIVTIREDPEVTAVENQLNLNGHGGESPMGYEASSPSAGIGTGDIGSGGTRAGGGATF